MNRSCSHVTTIGKMVMADGVIKFIFTILIYIWENLLTNEFILLCERCITKMQGLHVPAVIGNVFVFLV